MSFITTNDVHPKQNELLITRTNKETHEIIMKGIERSPIFSGKIEGLGQGIALQSKIKFTGSPIKNRIRYSLNQKD